jgi:hypothetical protein
LFGKINQGGDNVFFALKVPINCGRYQTDPLGDRLDAQFVQALLLDERQGGAHDFLLTQLGAFAFSHRAIPPLTQVNIDSLTVLLYHENPRLGNWFAADYRNFSYLSRIIQFFLQPRFIRQESPL